MNEKQCGQEAWAAVTEPGHNIWFPACKSHAPLVMREDGYLVRTFKKERK